MMHSVKQAAPTVYNVIGHFAFLGIVASAFFGYNPWKALQYSNIALASGSAIGIYFKCRDSKSSYKKAIYIVPVMVVGTNAAALLLEYLTSEALTQFIFEQTGMSVISEMAASGFYLALPSIIIVVSYIYRMIKTIKAKKS
jgi:uncharacterized membrane protein YfcA